MVIDVECPRCGASPSADVEGDTQVECEVCGATLDVSVSVDVAVSETPSGEGECPECGQDFSLGEINEENGSQSLTCGNCSAELEAKWSAWGRDMQVEVLEAPDDDEEEDEDEDEDEDEQEEEGDF